MATTVAQMNLLSDQLDALVDRITAEHNTELPKERRDAKGDAELLKALDRRKADLTTAFTMHQDARTAFMAAKAAYKVNPREMDLRYADALTLAAQIEAILDFRTSADSDAPAPDTKGKDKKEPATSADEGETKAGDGKTPSKSEADPAEGETKGKPDPAEGKGEDDKAKEKKGGSTPADDPIMAAITKLGEDCKTQHDETKRAIAALEAGLLKPELAKLLNTLDEETLRGILNRSGLTPIGVELMNVLGGYTPEELRVMLANLAAMSDGAEKLRRLIPGGKGKGEKVKK